MNKKIIILGGGAAGLIAGWFLKKEGFDVTLITEKVGGWQNITKKNYSLGPRLIEVDNNSNELLDFFNFDKIFYQNTIYYEYDSLDLRNYANDIFKEKYSLRTREIPPEKTHLSGSKNNYSVFKINYDLILQKCESYLEDNIILSKVLSINKDHVILYNGNKLKYDESINTIPLNIFKKISNINLNYDFKTFGTSFIKCECLDKNLIREFEDKNINYIYSIYDNLFHRINLIDKNEFVCEYKNNFDIENNKSDRFIFIEKTFIPSAQIQKSINLDHVFVQNKKIYLLGRYAQWSHGIIINDILKRIKNLKNNL